MRPGSRRRRRSAALAFSSAPRARPPPAMVCPACPPFWTGWKPSPPTFTRRLAMKPDLDLAPIGNCSVSALIDRRGRIVWACAPRIDDDPVFSALMDGEEPEHGFWAVELEGLASVEQAYVRNTAVLRTVMTGADGAAVEIIDFCPRHLKHSAIYRPTAFARVGRPLSCSPLIHVPVA